MIIRNKAEFFKLWREGVLGNRTLLFDTVRDALDHRPMLHRIGFRELGKTGGGKWALAESRAEALLIASEWLLEGRKFLCDGSVPNDKSVMQGEICRTEKGLTSFLCVRDILVYELAQSLPDSLRQPGLPPMRPTIAAGWHKSRGPLATKLLLERYMDASSRDDLEMLMEMYPDAAIEFTCFDVNVGVFPRRNTIFWEVRNY